MLAGRDLSCTNASNAVRWKCEAKAERLEAGAVAHILVIFDVHVKMPIASGSVPLMTGPTVPQST